MPTIEKNTRDSIRRFVQFMLGLESPTFLFHQILTFSPPQHDAKAAKTQLNRLLKNRFIRGAVYAEEIQGNGGIHYHLLLFFYEKHGLPFPPSKMREAIRAKTFKAWIRCNAGKLSPSGNRFKQHDFNIRSIWYLMKEAPLRIDPTTSATNWWGKWNTKFLVKRPVPPTKAEVTSAMKYLLPHRMPLPLGLRCSMREIVRERRDEALLVFSDPAAEWERMKQKETGRTDAVSDAELLAFRKAKADAWRQRQRLWDEKQRS